MGRNVTGKNVTLGEMLHRGKCYRGKCYRGICYRVKCVRGKRYTSLEVACSPHKWKVRSSIPGQGKVIFSQKFAKKAGKFKLS